jgi:hypothetical protein
LTGVDTPSTAPTLCKTPSEIAELVKALVPSIVNIASVVLAFVLSWKWGERLKADLALTVQKKIEAERTVSAAATEHLKSWLSEDVQRRLDADRGAQARELESQRSSAAAALQEIRVELERIAHLRTAAREKRAEIAAEVLFATLRFLDGLKSVVSVFSAGGRSAGAMGRSIP